MLELLWRLVALIVARPLIAQWLISRSKSEPYWHLAGYMHRWWLFNRYPDGDEVDYVGRHVGETFFQSTGRVYGWNGDSWIFERMRKYRPWLPSFRIHHILRADLDRHPHNHPWSFRTIILRGWYAEMREGQVWRILSEGMTSTLDDTEFHRITNVSNGGVWTLFITKRYLHTWGFKTEDGFVPHGEYLE